jgi:hypothetical protein
MNVQAVEVDGVLHLVCAWFGRCGNPTLKATEHPVLGPVPVCTQCARKAHIPDSKLIDCEVTAG